MEKSKECVSSFEQYVRINIWLNEKGKGAGVDR